MHTHTQLLLRPLHYTQSLSASRARQTAIHHSKMTTSTRPTQLPPGSYSNPAFCQQSEFYNKSPPRNNVRQSPVGAQTLPRHYDEQEFYEEMIVDDATGVVQQKKFVVLHNDSKRTTAAKTRYEYIPMREQEVTTPPKTRIQYHEEVEASTGVIHRYAVIPKEEEVEEPPKTSGRYALVPIEQLPAISQATNRYEYIDDNCKKVVTSQGNRYDYIDDTSVKKVTTPSTRYEYIEDKKMTTQASPSTRYDYIDDSCYKKMTSPQPPRRPNPVATQKLHDLLRTPRTPRTPPSRTQSLTSPNRPQVHQRPRAQQKLNYTIASRQQQQLPDKRSTAIVAPICSSPVQSVYSETTYSKSESWMNVSGGNKVPVERTLAVAAFMMVLCGSVTTGLCFYMISFMGRLYFLDFGVVSGFMCMLLGMLGFRSRNVYWLPNRNYISGYFMLSVFSLLTCAGLLVLLFVQPKPGSPLADMTSGAVCGISGLSLLLAGFGVVASYCCKVPPPDNRVQHCAQGFTV